MKKIKDDQTAKSKKAGQENNISSKVKTGSDEKTITYPEEFEEDRSMNIRMKPQPYNQSGKKSTKKD